MVRQLADTVNNKNAPFCFSLALSKQNKWCFIIYSFFALSLKSSNAFPTLSKALVS